MGKPKVMDGSIRIAKSGSCTSCHARRGCGDIRNLPGNALSERSKLSLTKPVSNDQVIGSTRGGGGGT